MSVVCKHLTPADPETDNSGHPGGIGAGFAAQAE